MRNIIAILLLCFASTSFYAQEESKLFETNNAIKISPVNFARAEFQLSYERYFNDRKSSLTIAPSLFLRDNNDESIEGFQLMTQYRFYLTHQNKSQRNTFLGMYNYGFYTGLYALGQKYTEDYVLGQYNSETQIYETNSYTKEVGAIEGGVLLGIQVDVTERILLDFFVGGGVRYPDVKDTFVEIDPNNNSYSNYSVFDPEYKGVKPVLGFHVGFLF